MIKLSSFSLFFILFSSCVYEYDTSTASSVHVIVAPYGVKEQVRSRNPSIFFSGGERVCRPEEITEERVREATSGYNLEEEVYKNIFGIDITAQEGQGADTTSDTRDSTLKKPVMVMVGEGWLKLGLYIANGSNQFLIINDIVFKGSATHKGKRYHYSANRGLGYCGTGFLYIVPPRVKLEYRPTSKNPFYNLTIYIDGFEIIKNYEKDPSTNQSNIGQNSSSQNGQAASSLGANSGANTGVNAGILSPILDPNEEPIVIPDYDVKMTLIGYFSTHSGERVSTFFKTVSFRTQSSLLYQ